MKTVAVVIPIYKSTLTALETRSLTQTYNVLRAHPIVVIKPQSLDLNHITLRYPGITLTSFDDIYFSGIEGYNHLMMSTTFYERFLRYQYILICQLDAYVFRDELLEWCDKGYDNIGAPWLEQPFYRWPIYSAYRRWKHARLLRQGKNSRQSLFNKVGNGGFSLKKTQSHYDAVVRHRAKIHEFLSHDRSHFYNEDVFWATQVPEFTYPDAMEALRFSFDKYPRYCYALNGHQLPFGCHSWYKRKMRHFWKPIIGF